MIPRGMGEGETATTSRVILEMEMGDIGTEERELLSRQETTHSVHSISLLYLFFSLSLSCFFE